MNKKYILMLFLLVNQLFSRIDCVVNGCGSSVFVINGLLWLEGMSSLVKCCNKHDICYEQCEEGQSKCDAELKRCLLNVCSQMSKISKSVCLINSNLMVDTVELLGFTAYCSHDNLKGRFLANSTTFSTPIHKDFELIFTIL